MKVKSQFEFKGKFILTLKDLEGNIQKVQEIDNLVVDAGKEVFARLVNGDATYSGEINYIAVGTGTSSAAVTDVKLETEIDRSVYDTSVRSGKQVTLEFTFGATEAIGALREIGAFIDGTASADTGQLFDRASIDIDKTALNSLTVQLVVTVV